MSTAAAIKPHEWQRRAKASSPEAFARYSGCERKVPYRNRRVAVRAAKGLERWAYECRYCKSWHLTSQVPIVEKMPKALRRGIKRTAEIADEIACRGPGSASFGSMTTELQDRWSRLAEEYRAATEVSKTVRSALYRSMVDLRTDTLAATAFLSRFDAAVQRVSP